MESVKEYIARRIQESSKMYVEDLEAMSHEQLSHCPNQTCRSGYDFTYETLYVNQRIATRLRGEDPGPWPTTEGFMRAPEEFRHRDRLISEFRSASDAVLSAWQALPDDKLYETIELPQGKTSPMEMINIVATHLSYHDGQLNYIQTLHNDAEVHWKFD